jgi:Undecaprenyl-phosphate glucose phosphotransferase
VVIVGTGPLAEIVCRKVEAHPDYGLVVRGMVAPRPDGAPDEVGGVPVIGAVADLPTLVEQASADLVYLALGRAEYAAEEEALLKLHDSTAAVRLVPDLARAFILNASVEDFDGMPVVLVTESPGQGWNAVAKRAFDLALAAIGLVVLAPVLAVIALWVRLDSPGPVLYAQERVGLNGRRFRMLKFRTMRADAEAGGAAGWTRPGDPRRTVAGKVLRTFSLDELPQLWNVLLGQMSLVGPRPERPNYVEQFRASVPRYMLRHHVKAGITGWAQINGLRGDTPLERRIEFDLYYIRNWSLAFDLKILLLTVARVFRDASAH